MRTGRELTLMMMSLVSCCFVCVVAAQTAREAPPKIDPTRFEDAIAAFEAEDKQSPPPGGAIVITGSSSVRRWHPTIEEDLTPLSVIPRGFGGSTMEDALYWIDRVAIAYKPRAIVIYEGDNDTGRYEVPPATIADQFEAILKKIHLSLPETRVYVISVKPSVSRWDTWAQAVATNDRLKAIAARNDLVTYIDVATPMLKSNGDVMTDIFVDDNLHLNAKGYKIWTAAVRSVLVPAEATRESTH